MINRQDLERIEAEECRKQEELQAYNEQNYIQWLRDVKPKWTEEQVLISAGKHFNKNFLPEKPIEEKPVKKKAVKKEGK